MCVRLRFVGLNFVDAARKSRTKSNFDSVLQPKSPEVGKPNREQLSSNMHIARPSYRARVTVDSAPYEWHYPNSYCYRNQLMFVSNKTPLWTVGRGERKCLHIRALARWHCEANGSGKSEVTSPFTRRISGVGKPLLLCIFIKLRSVVSSA